MASSSGQALMEAVAIYDFVAADNSQLAFQKGQIIKDVTVLDDGWAKGQLSGEYGRFPANFVEMRRPAPIQHPTPPENEEATPVQVVQDHAEQFLKEMNSAVLAPHLKAMGLIPAIVETNVLESKSKKEANAHLLEHLKEDADMKSVMETFRIASKEPGYGRMNTFADGVLRKLQQGS